MTIKADTDERGDLIAYLQILAGAPCQDRLLEIRFRTRTGMSAAFLAAQCTRRAAEIIARLSARTDVYTGVALRRRRAGGREAIDRCHLAFIDVDHADGQARLERFAHPPTMVIASGSAGHQHAYWRLSTAVEPTALEQINRRLAYHLGSDRASVDAGRILRPPATLNHKHDPPLAVRLVSFHPERSYKPARLTAGLADPSPRRPRSQTPREVSGDPLLAIPTADYVRALTGLIPNRGGKISCPFHEDNTPSLQLYEDGTWYCFGCRQGGSIYDFAATLWGTGTRRGAFLQLRARLTEQLAPMTPA